MLNDLKEKLLANLPTRPTGDTDMHMGESGFMRKLIRRKELESVFLFVTAKCNSKCRTCFYASETKKTDDLTFDEIRRLSETAPRFDKLWLSGGEPFLREDLAEIIALFHRNNGISVINLPTNGLLEDRVDHVVGRLLSSCPEMNIHLNFSLDGLGETHDRVRGVKDNFKKKTLKEIFDKEKEQIYSMREQLKSIRKAPQILIPVEPEVAEFLTEFFPRCNTPITLLLLDRYIN